LKIKLFPIYTVATINDESTRVVGWFPTKEEAELCILNNYGDIYEDEYYPTAVIEEVEMGLYPICEKSWWFKWCKRTNINMFQGYKPIKKPKKLKQIINFTIG
jgi:hypothetical protein